MTTNKNQNRNSSPRERDSRNRFIDDNGPQRSNYDTDTAEYDSYEGEYEPEAEYDGYNEDEHDHYGRQNRHERNYNAEYGLYENEGESLAGYDDYDEQENDRNRYQNQNVINTNPRRENYRDQEGRASYDRESEDDDREYFRGGNTGRGFGEFDRDETREIANRGGRASHREATSDLRDHSGRFEPHGNRSSRGYSNSDREDYRSNLRDSRNSSSSDRNYNDNRTTSPNRKNVSLNERYFDDGRNPSRRGEKSSSRGSNISSVSRTGKKNDSHKGTLPSRNAGRGSSASGARKHSSRSSKKKSHS